MKVTATIQARSGSSRLPEKVLRPIMGKPLLAHQIERVKCSRLVDEVVVATTTNPKDDRIAELCESVGAKVFRGSENDVLGRVAQCLRTYDVGVHVELLGDSPLTCPTLLNEVIGYYFKNQNQYDFVSNDLKVTYPPGLEVKVYPASVLIQLDDEIPKSEAKREHVSYHIVQRPNQFRLCNLEASGRYLRPDCYLEVDTQEDFDVMSQVLHDLYRPDRCFTIDHILDYLDANPDLFSKNRHVHRRWLELK